MTLILNTGPGELPQEAKFYLYSKADESHTRNPLSIGVQKTCSAPQKVGKLVGDEAGIHDLHFAYYLMQRLDTVLAPVEDGYAYPSVKGGQTHFFLSAFRCQCWYFSANLVLYMALISWHYSKTELTTTLDQ